MESKTITVAELAKYMHISKPMAYQLTHRDGFPAIMIGRRIVIPVSAFEEWLLEQARQGRQVG